ncbi:C40 family peptidase [Oceanobacillus kimchii]|uniref:C40 family peptidase n=1 Tax=Oceanobacillus kimchii TaxID=746691 RepID=UPI0021A7BF2B|nr:C40 family peptidase [Oceanobacillus kimchii]MCT1576617.1 C40 family peptidase [Oceanobacillus kimchii]MCT2134687.1 C40 family peptidase [Oceanobacillus kimchii]
MNQTLDQLTEDFWVTDVQVATVWTNPQSVRDIDKDGRTNPTNINKWYEKLFYDERLALCNENRVQTQALYGEPVIVINELDDWAEVVLPFQASKKDIRGYPGWIPKQQLTMTTKSDWVSESMVMVNKNKSWLETQDGRQTIEISFATILPLVTEEQGRVQVQTPHGVQYLAREDVLIFPTREGVPTRTGEDIVRTGIPFLRLDYFWGGMSAFGYDCSGLAYATHKANGYWIARDASDQAAGGKEVPFNELQSGDLLFFAYEEGKGSIHHVGIYKGNDEMLHSPQTGKGIEITPLAGTKYEKELCAARRYW